MTIRRTRPARMAVWASISILLFVVFEGRAIAQARKPFTPSANPVTDAVRNRLTRDAKNLTAAAELMPSERYGYQPTPGQMTYGALIAHIVQTNVAICSAFTDANPPMRPEELKKVSGSDSKEVLMVAIRHSFDFCTAAIIKLQDAALREEATMFGRNTGMSRADALLTIAADWADHYSTAAAYLRLNGILPPTARKPE